MTRNRRIDKEHERQTRDEEQDQTDKGRQIDEGMIRQTRNKIRKMRTGPEDEEHD
jgi:hypothetical protein